jgi:hypothetical protein
MAVISLAENKIMFIWVTSDAHSQLYSRVYFGNNVPSRSITGQLSIAQRDCKKPADLQRDIRQWPWMPTA